VNSKGGPRAQPVVTGPGLNGREKERWVFPGIEDHWRPGRSAGSSSPTLPERLLYAEPLRRRMEFTLPTAGSQVKAGIRAEPIGAYITSGDRLPNGCDST
jgi:hypothetical protein